MVYMPTVRYGIDVLMGITFLVCFVIGLLKFTFLMRMLGLTSILLPLALMSDIHDWAGIALALLVAIHLVINRVWILSMTRRLLGLGSGTGNP